MEGKLDAKYTPFEDQLANITKPLPNVKFSSLKSKLMMIPSLSV